MALDLTSASPSGRRFTPRHNVGAANFLLGAWLLLVIQSVLPDMVLCAKPGIPVNLEFATLDSRCDCGPCGPVGGEKIPEFLSADDSCNDSPFATDFRKATTSGTMASCRNPALEMADVDPMERGIAVIPGLRNRVDRKYGISSPPFLGESLRC